MERGDGQDAQPAQGQLGGAAGGGQQALGVGQLPALQAGQVAAHPEQIHVEPLQVLLPLLNLGEREQGDLRNSAECSRVTRKMLFLSHTVAWLTGALPPPPAQPSRRHTASGSEGTALCWRSPRCLARGARPLETPDLGGRHVRKSVFPLRAIPFTFTDELMAHKRMLDVCVGGRGRGFTFLHILSDSG